MDWAQHGSSWPHHEASRFVSAGGTRWHVQDMGAGEHILLLHGTGATTHSFAGLLPLLAERYRVTAIDLPGHGFTGLLGAGRPTLDGVCSGIRALLAEIDVDPAAIVGHSAGAAIAVHMTAKGLLTPRALVAINGAFYPFAGAAGQIFPAFAKLLFLNPLVPRLFAKSASRRKRVLSLIRSTGSRLSESQIALYQHALSSSRHVEGTLEMMANWDLRTLESELANLDVPVLQVIGGRDGTVKPSLAQKTETLLKNGSICMFEHCGHLVHEEKPEEVATAILEFAAAFGTAQTA